MVVVDTNVVAAIFIRSRLTEQALKLRSRDALWCVDPFAVIEFSNVLATYQRAGYLTRSAALERLRLAEAFLSPNYLHVSNAAALELALRHNITAYDARFLAVARQFRRKLVTDDAKLRAAAPGLTQSIDDALSAA
jgi:predicted nucleic acid-binding protein